MNKKVFITGGSGGLGLAVAKKHLELGDTVWATDIDDNQDIAALLAENGKLTFIPCDISKTDSVRDKLGTLASAIGSIDYFYSCAGIYMHDDKKKLADINLDNAAYTYEVNAVGFLRVVQILLPAIQTGTVMMCVTSEAGSIGENWRDGEYNYCMSKAAQNMACVILQKHFETAGQDTRVLCLHPGWLRTKMGGPAAFANPNDSVDPQESADKIVGIALDIENIPKERMYMTYNRKDIAW